MFFKLGTEITSEVELLVTKYIKVAPRPFILTEPLAAIQSWSSCLGRVMDLLDMSASWQEQKHSRSSSDQKMVSWNWRPAISDSRGVRSLAAPLRTRPSMLYEPTKAWRPGTFLEARNKPEKLHDGETRESSLETISNREWQSRLGRLWFSRVRGEGRCDQEPWGTFVSFVRSSWWELPPSSAILATQPSWKRSPRMRHISSLRAVSEPVIPMAQCM